MLISVMAAYFEIVRAAAASAGEPGREEVAERYDGANESTTVASHVRHRLFCHETNVRPSGRFPSSLSNPDGSLVAGTSAFEGPPNMILDLMMARRPPSLLNDIACLFYFPGDSGDTFPKFFDEFSCLAVPYASCFYCNRCEQVGLQDALLCLSLGDG